MKTIYVVQGESGEYDEHTEWIVRAYTNEEMAKEVAGVLNAIVADVLKNRREFVAPSAALADAQRAVVADDPLVQEYKIRFEKVKEDYPPMTEHRKQRIKSRQDLIPIPESVQRLNALDQAAYKEYQKNEEEQRARINFVDENSEYSSLFSLEYTVYPIELV